jgi:peroxiredoxin Q/BCP
MKVGDKAPDFSLKDSSNKEWKLSSQLGKVVVMLFYPADNSPVCTAQLCSVRDNWEAYKATGAEVVGISTDTVASHSGFAEKYDLPINLLSDEKGEVSELYGMKSWLPGRSARGVVIIDREGRIAYRKVQPISLIRPKDEEILSFLKELK